MGRGLHINSIVLTKTFCRAKIIDLLCALLKIKDQPQLKTSRILLLLTPQNKLHALPISSLDKHSKVLFSLLKRLHAYQTYVL